MGLVDLLLFLSNELINEVKQLGYSVFCKKCQFLCFKGSMLIKPNFIVSKQNIWHQKTCGLIRITDVCRLNIFFWNCPIVGMFHSQKQRLLTHPLKNC